MEESMKIYIVTIGDYEANHNDLVTTDFDTAIEKIMDILKNNHGCNNGFTSLECWEDGNQLYEYGDWCHDIAGVKRDITKEELLEDIEYHIKNRWK
jgi:hypothetical protein